MRKPIWISSAFMFAIAIAMAHPAFAASAGEREVLTALDGMKEALLKRDRATLEGIFHPDLTYSHSSATVENKTQAIARIMDGLGWEAIELADTSVRLQGNVAIVNGKADLHQRYKDKPTTVIKLLILTVWVKGPQGWQLIARQAVRRPDDAQVIAAQAALAAATSAATAKPANISVPAMPPK
jgi:ketosteroid isomerase-like protein